MRIVVLVLKKRAIRAIISRNLYGIMLLVLIISWYFRCLDYCLFVCVCVRKKVYPARGDQVALFWTVFIINSWNRLPRDIRCIHERSVFKSAVVTFLWNQELHDLSDD